MTKYHRPKGTFDTLPDGSWKDSDNWAFVERVFRDVSRDFGFREMRTPTFESTDLFLRSVGESSDIASKEMYTFKDKGDRSMSLRPEGTAPILRAFIENGMQQMGHAQKIFYMGPYFRYDRPQAGRYRQFHQFGVEAIGIKSPEQDAEVIDMVMETYRRLGLKDVRLLVNSIGEKECRARYIEALKAHLKPHAEKLSKDSQTRIETNPLRILDSKDKGDQELLKNAPQISDFLSEESRAYFDRVCDLLTLLGIDYTVDSSLVRGLDYYCHTVFEITAGQLGAQNSIGGGGRYDTLMKQLGGPDLPGIGFALGIERILLTLEAQNFAFPEGIKPFVYFIGMSEKALEHSLFYLTQMRRKHIPGEIFLKGKKVQKGMQAANNLGAKYVIVLGDDELESGRARVKEMASGSESELALNEMVDHIDALWGEHA